MENLTFDTVFQTDATSALIRTEIIQILTNVINEYLKVHQMTAEEITAIQKAIDAETKKTQEILQRIENKVNILDSDKNSDVVDPLGE